MSTKVLCHLCQMCTYSYNYVNNVSMYMYTYIIILIMYVHVCMYVYMYIMIYNITSYNILMYILVQNTLHRMETIEY